MTLFGTYCKSSIKPPPPGGGLFILSPFEDGGGLIEAGGGGIWDGGSFNLAKTMVLVLH